MASKRKKTKAAKDRRRRAVYLLGLAAVRQFERGAEDPDSLRERDLILRWALFWLSEKQMNYVVEQLGEAFDLDLTHIIEDTIAGDIRERELFLSQPDDSDEDHGIPF